MECLLNLLDVCAGEDTVLLRAGVDANPPAVGGLVLDGDNVALQQIDLLLAVLCGVVVQGFRLAHKLRGGLGSGGGSRGGLLVRAPGLAVQRVDVLVHELAGERARLDLAPAGRKGLLSRRVGEPRLALLCEGVLVHKLARAGPRLDAAPALRQRLLVLLLLRCALLGLKRSQGLLVLIRNLRLLGVHRRRLRGEPRLALARRSVLVHHLTRARPGLDTDPACGQLHAGLGSLELLQRLAALGQGSLVLGLDLGLLGLIQALRHEGRGNLLSSGLLREPRLTLLRVDVLVHEFARAGAGLDTAPAGGEGPAGIAGSSGGGLALLKGLAVALLDVLRSMRRGSLTLL
eukprot:m.221645 g.221645  ORF g.221645 m.221645 type:complete len:346 (+) comp10624_c0_seq1:31-1068(+)